MGRIFASNQKAYAKWRQAIDRKAGKSASLTGAALESAVMNVARTFPDNVIRGTL